MDEKISGEKHEQEKNMRRKETHTDPPKKISEATIEPDPANFLPPPEKLLRKEQKVKITITLNHSTIDFFKKHAKKNNVKYQTMINELLTQYVQKYS